MGTKAALRQGSLVMPAFLAFGALFVVACGVGARELTLFWDDYEFILMQARDPFGSILMGTNGHAGPMSRLFLRAASHLFGLWYPGYAMLNASLAVATTAMFLAAIRPRVTRWSWLLPVAGIVYLTSLGLVSQVFIAICLEWFVSMCFAAGAALAVSRRAHWAVWGGLLLASWISWSGAFALNACLVAVVYFISRWPEGAPDPRVQRRIVAVVVGLVLVGVAGGLAGSTLALLNPSDYYRGLSEARGPVPLPSDPLNVLATAAYLSAAWVSAPLLVVALTSPTMVMTVTIFFAAHAPLFWSALAALVLVALLGFRLVSRRTSWSQAIHLLAPVAMLLPAIVWALLLATAREGAPFPVRYQMIWLLPVVLFYAMVLTLPARSRFLVVLQSLGAALLVAAAVVGVVRLPSTLALGPDGDKPRSEQSMSQRALMLECRNVDGPLPRPNQDISPLLPAEDFCTVVDYLRENSVAGRVFGFDG